MSKTNKSFHIVIHITYKQISKTTSTLGNFSHASNLKREKEKERSHQLCQTKWHYFQSPKIWILYRTFCQLRPFKFGAFAYYNPDFFGGNYSYQLKRVNIVAAKSPGPDDQPPKWPIKPINSLQNGVINFNWGLRSEVKS